LDNLLQEVIQSEELLRRAGSEAGIRTGEEKES
jgi:hypothetical protein